MSHPGSANTFAKEIGAKVERAVGGVFRRYGFDLQRLLTPIKWKPLVLIIGNYSSGKSTFINEFVGHSIQRTGQAPTDDSFTVITSPDPSWSTEELPGTTLVGDERLPFGALRRFGESFLAHFRLKAVDSPHLQELALVDTPGMLDSVTEKDRGYDYLGVIKELARLADLIILMFDPHKAGTIKETYQAIRSVLPAATGEDRVLYVLNRIDECESLSDLVRSYGTLCWNLSQMTGRKDIPRIFITFAPRGGEVPPELRVWLEEREELKEAIKKAPRMRVNRILEEVDGAVREQAMLVKALAGFKQGFWDAARNSLKMGAVLAVMAFLLGDVVMNLLFGAPKTPLVMALLSGKVGFQQFLLPTAWLLLTVALVVLYLQRWRFPRYVKQVLADLDRLVPLKDHFEEDIWAKVKGRVAKAIQGQARRHVWMNHRRALRRLEGFLETELKALYAGREGGWPG